jgi:hypothetical protein
MPCHGGVVLPFGRPFVADPSVRTARISAVSGESFTHETIPPGRYPRARGLDPYTLEKF